MSRPREYMGLRSLLVLGRVSNLPTVWSNCLAGWILGGGGDLTRFLWASLGAMYLYLGGTFLNDAFDAQFDEQRRPERPIPSGQIRLETVWKWGLCWIGLGLGCLMILGKTTATLALLLALTIVVYDAIHKIFAFSPLFMAGCRFLLVLVAASAAEDGVTGLAIWSALALAAYVLGLSYLARKESIKTAVRYWPCWFLGAPLLLAFVVNGGEYRTRSGMIATLLLIWTLLSLRHIVRAEVPNIGRSVGGLLAGIVLVDWLAVGGGSPSDAIVFAGLFGLALLLQRYVPAT